MKQLFESIVSLAKRKGFVFPSSEIYGGLSSAWDYGPLGAQLKQNIQQHWWKTMTRHHEDIVGIDSSILMHPRVWEASGHTENFIDIMVEDTITHERYRYDHLSEEQRAKNISPKGNPLSEKKPFNLMFETAIGAMKDTAQKLYLRPETAQGIYVNFRNVLNTSRKKLPFGIAQVGKAFRNEIVTKSFIFRTCEFEQMEMQYFVTPGSDDEWFQYWKKQRTEYYKTLGIRTSHLQLHPHGENELAHYAKEAVDIQYNFPFGWQELEGIHNRGQFDLKQHTSYSGVDLQYFDQEKNEKYTPVIVETSVGLTRLVLMVLCDSYDEEELENETRVVLRMHPVIAPVKLAVFPLVKKDGLREKAHAVFKQMSDEFSTEFDVSGAIGRRYRRQDEIGTPYCVTIDYQSLKDNSVTIRFRDSMKQRRIRIEEIADVIRASDKAYVRMGESQ